MCPGAEEVMVEGISEKRSSCSALEKASSVRRAAEEEEGLIW